MKKLLIALLAISWVASAALASITTTYNDTITYINGSGNPNDGWVSAVDSATSNLKLGIRADNRTTGATPNNGAGTYTFQPGTVSSIHGPVATWNYQFTINSDTAAGNTKLSTYDYYLTLNGSTPFNLLSLPDNTYGNNSTVQGTGTFGAGSLASSYNVAANSESITFLGLPNNGGIYNFDLYATVAGAGSGGSKVDEVSMTVDVVPEPTTVIAGALLLLPFGVNAFRNRQKNRTT